MKLLQSNLITFDYFGIELTLPKGWWVAVDEDGDIYAFGGVPLAFSYSWETIRENVLLGKVNLQGVDWRETRREVKR